MSTNIILTSKRDNLTIGRWYWPSKGYELMFSQTAMQTMSQQDLSLLRAALADGRLVSDVPLDAFLSGQASSTITPNSVAQASVDSSVGREVRAVVDNNDNVTLVALGYGPIEVPTKDSSVTVINDLTSGGASLPLSAEQGKVLNDTKYTKPTLGIPASDLSPAVRVTLDKAETAYQKPAGGIPDTDLSSGARTSLSKADSAYQKPADGIPAADLSATAQDALSKAGTAYQKPVSGIPATDLSSSAQASLSKADSSYQKPVSGIPAADLSSAAQTSLAKADTAYQKPSNGIPATDLDAFAQAKITRGGNAVTSVNGVTPDANGNVAVSGGSGSESTTTTVVNAGGGLSVKIEGEPGIGNTLTAVLPEGWGATGYQWYRDGNPISGASSRNYILSNDDSGKRLTVGITGLYYVMSGGLILP